jgi:hypothetical protein
MPMLFVKCHGCGQGFPSGIAPATGTPGGVELLGVLARCPACSDESRYNTHEFFFPTTAPVAESAATPPPMSRATVGPAGEGVTAAEVAVRPLVPGTRPPGGSGRSDSTDAEAPT